MLNNAVMDVGKCLRIFREERTGFQREALLRDLAYFCAPSLTLRDCSALHAGLVFDQNKFVRKVLTLQSQNGVVSSDRRQLE